MNSRRDLSYDVVRVAAMLFVIAIHTNPKPFAYGTLGMEVFLSLLYACNGLFFMLSGRFALATELNGVPQILQFYKRKFFTLFLPFVFFGAFSYWVDLFRKDAPYTAGTFFGGAARGLLGELNGGYLWFMFVLIGLTISAPFLGKMVRRMTVSELHLLAGIGLIWEVLSVYLGKNAGLGFGYSGWLLTGWVYYYFLGYYVFRVTEPEKIPDDPKEASAIAGKQSRFKRAVMIAGLFGFILNGLWTFLMPERSYNAHDLSPLYTLYVVGFYLLLRSIKIRPGGVFGKIISFIAAQSYFAYLIHRNILKLCLNHADWFSSKGANYLAHFAVCAVCSVFLAWLFNLIYRPVIKRTSSKKTKAG